MEKFAVRKTKFALFILAVSHHTFCSVKIHVVKLQGRNKIYEVKWSGRNKIYEVKPPKRNKVYEVNPQKRNKIYYMKRPGQKTLQFANKKFAPFITAVSHYIFCSFLAISPLKFVSSWLFPLVQDNTIYEIYILQKCYHKPPHEARRSKAVPR